MTDLEFWREFRAALLMIAALIERKYLNKTKVMELYDREDGENVTKTPPVIAK